MASSGDLRLWPRWAERVAAACGMAAMAAASGEEHAVASKPPERAPFLFDITTFTTTLTLPVTDQLETVKMTPGQMALRLERAKRDETVEPLSIVLADDAQQIDEMAAKIAADGERD